MAGALGLEPRAYGFGDEADKSASGGTSFEVNISTFQKRIAAAITKTDSKIKQIGNFINKPTVFWDYGLICRNRRLRKYIIIRCFMQDPADFFFALLASIALSHSQVSTLEKNPPKASTFWRIPSSFIQFRICRRCPQGTVGSRSPHRVGT